MWKKLTLVFALLTVCLTLTAPAQVGVRGKDGVATNLMLRGVAQAGVNHIIATNGTNSLVVGNPARGDGISQIHLRDGALWMPEFLGWGYLPASQNKFAGAINFYSAGQTIPQDDPLDFSGGFAKLTATTHWGGAAYEPWAMLTCLNVRLEEGWQNYQLRNPAIHIGNEDHYGSVVINYTQPWDSTRTMVNGGVGRGRPLVFAARGRDGSGSFRAEPGIQSRPAGRMYSRINQADGVQSYAGELYFHSQVPLATTNGTSPGVTQGSGQDQATAWQTLPGLTNGIMHVDWWEWLRDMRLTSGTNHFYAVASNYPAGINGDSDNATPSYNAIVYPTNLVNFPATAKGSMAVPNGFAMGDLRGNYIWFLPSHSPGSRGLMRFQAAGDYTFACAPNGGGQIGTSGQNYNETWYLQYNQNVVGGYSHMLGFNTKSSDVGNIGQAAIIAQNNGVDTYSDLHFYTKAPTFPTYPATGLATPGTRVMSLDTDASAAGTGVRVNKRLTQARVTSTTSTIALDFGAEYLQDVTAASATLTVTFANQRPGGTNITKKLLYLRSGATTVSSITWPSGISVVSEAGSSTALPTSLAALKLLRVEFESVGSAAADVVARHSVGDDNNFAYDSDASTYFAAVQTAGVTLTAPQKAAVNAFVVTRKTDGTWADADLIHPFVGGTAAAHAVPLKGAAMSFVNGVTHSANGAVFDGVDDYGDTGWAANGGVNFIQDSARIVAVLPTSSTTSAANDSFMASYGGNLASFYRNSSSVVQISGLNNSLGSGAAMSGVTDDRGVFVGTRTGASAVAAYYWIYNAAIGASPTVSATGSGASVGRSTLNTTVGARKWGASAGQEDQHAAVTVSGYETGAGADATKAQKIRDSWAALQNALGR